MPPLPLANQYFLMRHGTSEANEQQLIVSDPIHGCRDYGLSENGRQGLQENEARLRQKLANLDFIFCSDFRRTMETAQFVGNLFGMEPRTSIKLRERFFGQFEKTSSDNYPRVWEEDRKNPEHRQWEVESVTDVAQRMTQLLESIESSSQGKVVLLVSHGDPLHILQTVQGDFPLKSHRDRPTFSPGQLQPLTRKAME